MRKKLVEVMKRLSEQRVKLNELLGAAEPTEAQTAAAVELRTTLADGETEYRLALDDEPEPPGSAADVEVDGAERERLQLRAKSTAANYMRAAVLGRALDGAEAEYSAAYHCPGSVPFALFEPRRSARPGVALEERAVTPGPATVGVELQPIVPAIFARSSMAWLGVEMPTVGTGDQAYPVLSTDLTAGPKAKGAGHLNTAGAFRVTTVKPRSVGGAFTFQKEDAARLDGMEEALRVNLAGVVSDAVDNQGINGTGTGDGTINGLLATVTAPTAPVAEAETFARFVAAMADWVDGVYAVDLMGVRALLGAETYRHAAVTFRSDESDTTAENWMQANTGGVRVSSKIPAKAAHIQKAIIRRANPAGDAAAVMPVWEGLELIRDPYTGAGKREITITGTVLVGDVIVLRSLSFHLDAFRVSV